VPMQSVTMQQRPLQLQSPVTRVSLAVTWCKYCITVTWTVATLSVKEIW
jgi:hypothetical protein